VKNRPSSRAKPAAAIKASIKMTVKNFLTVIPPILRGRAIIHGPGLGRYALRPESTPGLAWRRRIDVI